MKIRTNEPFWIWTAFGSCILGFVTIWATANSVWFDRPPKPIGDGMCYESIAFSLFSGQAFRENYESDSWRSIYSQDSNYDDFLNSVKHRDVPATGRPPLYPTLVATIYAIFGRTNTAFMTVRIVSALCIAVAGGLSVGLCAKVLSYHQASSRVIFWGSCCTLVIAASQRTVRDYATDFLTEPLALFLTQVLITLVIFDLLDIATQSDGKSTENMVDRLTLWRSVIAGVVFGLMVLTRSLFIIWFPGLILLIYFSFYTTNRVRLYKVTLFACFALLVCLPWWTHNCMVLKKFMPLGTQGPIALAGGYCDESFKDGGNWNFTPERRIRGQVVSETVGDQVDQLSMELAVVAASKKAVLDWIGANKSLLPMIALKRAASHWNPYTGRALLWKVTILLGALWAVFRSHKLRWWLVGLPLLSTAVTMLTYETGGRFLVPLYGLLFTLSGLGLSGWLHRQD